MLRGSCKIFSKRSHPDGVRLEGLRRDFIDPAGRSALRGWVWDKAYREYDSGKKAEYPSSVFRRVFRIENSREP